MAARSSTPSPLKYRRGCGWLFLLNHNDHDPSWPWSIKNGLAEARTILCAFNCSPPLHTKVTSVNSGSFLNSSKAEQTMFWNSCHCIQSCSELPILQNTQRLVDPIEVVKRQSQRWIWRVYDWSANHKQMGVEYCLKIKSTYRREAMRWWDNNLFCIQCGSILFHLQRFIFCISAIYSVWLMDCITLYLGAELLLSYQPF